MSTGKAVMKRPVLRHRDRCEDNIKMELREMGPEHGD
jgi:hypothetical protein